MSNITQVNVTNVYRNVSINNGVTVVNRNTFNTGSPTIVNVNRNVIQQKIFVKNNISVGTPEIKPARGSYFASARPVPPAKLPPQPIRNVKIGELKHSRPFTREPDKSVMNRGAKPRTLQVTTIDKPRTPRREGPVMKNNQPAVKVGPRTPVGPAPKGERPQFQPRGNNRLIDIPGPPGPRGEKPQVPTLDKGKSVTPAGPTPKTERPQFQPRGNNRQIDVPVTPGPRGERPQVPTLDKGKSVTPVGPAPKVERPQFQPRGNNRQIDVPVTPGPRGDKTTGPDPGQGEERNAGGTGT